MLWWLLSVLPICSHAFKPPSCILNPMLKRVILVAAFAGVVWSQDISLDLPYVSIDIRTAPVAPQIAGGYLLQYELFVTNWYDKDIKIKAIDILAGDVLLTTLEADVLDGLFAAGSGQTAIVGPRQTTTMILSAVTNHFQQNSTKASVSALQANSQDTIVRYRGTPTSKNVRHLHPPVRGESWVVLSGPVGNNHHIAAVLQFEGRMLVPQRFAIDFNRAYEDGELVHGDRADVHNYRCYGAEVFAIADARVISVRNDVPDNPGETEADTLRETLANLGGNRVVLDLGGGKFHHLLPPTAAVDTCEGERYRPLERAPRAGWKLGLERAPSALSGNRRSWTDDFRWTTVCLRLIHSGQQEDHWPAAFGWLDDRVRRFRSITIGNG
jgi:hypothetical protein